MHHPWSATFAYGCWWFSGVKRAVKSQESSTVVLILARWPQNSILKRHHQATSDAPPTIRVVEPVMASLSASWSAPIALSAHYAVNVPNLWCLPYGAPVKPWKKRRPSNVEVWVLSRPRWECPIPASRRRLSALPHTMTVSSSPHQDSTQASQVRLSANALHHVACPLDTSRNGEWEQPSQHSVRH